MPQSPISVSFSQALHLTSGMCPGNECKVRYRRRPTRRAVSYFASLLRSSASLSSLASSFHAVLYSTPVSQPRAFSLGNYQHSSFSSPFPPSPSSSSFHSIFGFHARVPCFSAVARERSLRRFQLKEKRSSLFLSPFPLSLSLDLSAFGCPWLNFALGFLSLP